MDTQTTQSERVTQKDGALIVKLEWAELDAGACAGTRRRLRAILNRREYGNGNPAGEARYWKNDIEGCLAELAAGIALGLRWTETEGLDKAGGDVGGLQIRATDRYNGSLIMQRGDGDAERFVLIVHKIPYFKLCGWIYGREGKMQEYVRSGDGRPASAVPARPKSVGNALAVPSVTRRPPSWTNPSIPAPTHP
jgi:hypothetical protein